METEGNGLLTYDRAVIKPNLELTAEANKGDFSHVAKEMVIVPTSQAKGQVWSYTFDKPAADWYKPDFDDAKWKKGEGAFGAHSPAPIRTQWTTDDVCSAGTRRCRPTPFLSRISRCFTTRTPRSTSTAFSLRK